MLLSEATREFFADLRSRDKSEHTIIAYNTALNRLLEKLGDIDLDELGADDVVHYAADLEGYSPSTVNLYITAVHQFAQFAADELGASFDASMRRRLERYRRKVYADPMDYPKDDEVDQLLTTIRETPMHGEIPRLRRLRDLALIETLRSTGCRNAEVRHLKREDLVTAQHVANVKGKGKKPRTVIFDDQAWEALMMFLEAVDEYYDEWVAKGPIFRKMRGYPDNGPLTDKALCNILRLWSEKAGVRYYSPHAWRHRFCSTLYRATRDLILVQTAAGHADPKTTTRYMGEIKTRELMDAVKGANL